jgi:iron complex outermembrane receptor protein
MAWQPTNAAPSHDVKQEMRELFGGNTMPSVKPAASIEAANNHVMRPLTAAVLSALYPTTQAVAQDQDDEFALEEIVVTATKRSMTIQAVPQSIIAFSTAEIERRGMLDMADIASNLPSITLSSSRAGRNELVYRGISNGGSWFLDSQVAMYLDEMPMTMSTTQLDPRMVDIARVESLPGPQGTLFGSSSQAGTLRIVTNRPETDAFSGEISTELKSTDGGEESYDINGWINIPVSDNFAVRVVGYKLKEGGYIDNVYSTAPHSVCVAGRPLGPDHDYYCDTDPSVYAIGPFNPVDNQGYLTSPIQDNAEFVEDDFNDYEMTGARISALWNINEDWDAILTVMNQDSKTTGVWFSDTAIGDYKVARFSDEWRKDDWTTTSLTITGDLGFAELTNSFGYADRVQSYQFDNTHYEPWHTRLKGQYWSAWANYVAYWDYVYYGTPIPQYNYYDKYDTDYNGGVYVSLQDSDRITNELRLTSTTDSRFQWMVGVFYENFKDGWDDNGIIQNLENTKHWAYTQWRTCDLQNQGYPTECPLTFPENSSWYRSNYRRDRSQIAAFGQIDYDLTDDLRFTFGMRWFEFDRYTVYDRQWPPGLPVEAILLEDEAASIEDGKESDTTFKVGLSYNLTDDKMVYALFSQGFRLGGKNNPKAVRENFVPDLYEPDLLNNYEIGLKSEWMNGRMVLNATVFYLDWDDIQLSFSSDQSGLWWLRGQGNGAGGENTGAELDLIWQATDRLLLNFNGYTGNPEYVADYINQEGTQLLTKGTKMPDSARHKITLAADYRMPDVFGGEMWFRYDYQWQSEMFSSLSRADEANPNSPDYVPGSDYDVDSFHKSNFQIGWEKESWTARLMVRNLTNERANTYTFRGTGWYAEYWGHTGFGDQHTLARPRTISLKLTKRFD